MMRDADTAESDVSHRSKRSRFDRAVFLQDDSHSSRRGRCPDSVVNAFPPLFPAFKRPPTLVHR